MDILLVEDSPEDAELIVRALRGQNPANRLHHVEDGAAALEVLRGGPRPRVVLLDLKLPKVDGLEVLRQLKTTHRTRRIPVVILTSSREDRDLKRACNLGVNSYVVKPVDSRKFSEIVAQIGLYWLRLNEVPSS